MSAIAKTLGIARSNLIERAASPVVRRGPYRKPEDANPLAEIRPIIDRRADRPTAIDVSPRRSTGNGSSRASRPSMPSGCCGSCQHHLRLQRHTAQRPEPIAYLKPTPLRQSTATMVRMYPPNAPTVDSSVARYTEMPAERWPFSSPQAMLGPSLMDAAQV